jgi:hypothetical protein
MVDLKNYYENQKARRRYSPSETIHLGPPTLMDESDLRNWTSDCDCTICIKMIGQVMTDSKFPAGEYNRITNMHTSSLPDHHYLLCPKVIRAFIFKTRSWGTVVSSIYAHYLLTITIELLHICNLKEPGFERDMIDNLVIEPALAKTLKSLTMSYAGINVLGESLARGLWSADFVEGKGSGLIFLLHGTPGVGKTFTAGMSSKLNG